MFDRKVCVLESLLWTQIMEHQKGRRNASVQLLPISEISASSSGTYQNNQTLV